MKVRIQERYAVVAVDDINYDVIDGVVDVPAASAEKLIKSGVGIEKLGEEKPAAKAPAKPRKRKTAKS